VINSQVSTVDHTPRILVFFCEQCCGHKSSLANLSLQEISDSLSSLHFKCAREVSTAQIRQGFAAGADGVLIFGCLVRSCASQNDNLAVLQSLYRNRIAVKNLGLEPERLREEWVVQGTTDCFEEVVADFVRQLAVLGPRSAAPLKTQTSQA
jgi:coenzyme F420-reducing hydrogenase delta subunit